MNTEASKKSGLVVKKHGNERQVKLKLEPIAVLAAANKTEKA